MIHKEIDALFKEQESKDIFKIWCTRFLYCKTLRDMWRRYEDLILICGKEYFTPYILKLLENIRQPTALSGATNDASLPCYEHSFINNIVLFNVGPSPWKSINLDMIPSKGQYYKQSPFSYLALCLCYKHNVDIPKSMYADTLVEHAVPDEEKDNTPDSRTVRNPHFNLLFLQYIIKQVFIFTPMYTHCLIRLNEWPGEDDTNATSEAWNKVAYHYHTSQFSQHLLPNTYTSCLQIVKVDELEADLPMKVGRLVEKLQDSLNGWKYIFVHVFPRFTST